MWFPAQRQISVTILGRHYYRKASDSRLSPHQLSWFLISNFNRVKIYRWLVAYDPLCLNLVILKCEDILRSKFKASRTVINSRQNLFITECLCDYQEYSAIQKKNMFT